MSEKVLSSPAQSFTRGTAEDARLLRKVDLHLIPILGLLYLLSFLDRSNIGNAKLEGLTTDLGVKGGNYNTALALFFVGYVCFEVPSQLVLKRFNPKVWLPTLAFLWGVVTLAQGFVKNQAQLFGIRLLLGVYFVGGLLDGMSQTYNAAGCVYVFSLWYPRHLRHFRVALFFSGAALAGAFGGILAYVIALMGHTAGIPPWAWIFIIEALITIVAAGVAYFLIPASVKTAGFLTQSEKEHIHDMLVIDSDAVDQEALNWNGVKQALLDPAVYGYALLWHAHSFALYSISLFTPTIIKELGTWKVWQSQLLSTPPYVLAFIVTMSAAFASHKYQRRAPFIIGLDAVALIGYIILIADTRPGPSYVGLFLVITGLYAASALVLSWPAENVSSQTKRATALGMQISIGNCGAITSVLIYRPEFAAHFYRKPFILTLCYVAGGIFVASGLWFFLERSNRQRAALLANTEKQRDAVEESYEERQQRRSKLGDRDPTFVYQL